MRAFAVGTPSCPSQRLASRQQCAMLLEAGLEWHGPVHVMLTKRDDEPENKRSLLHLRLNLACPS